MEHQLRTTALECLNSHENSLDVNLKIYPNGKSLVYCEYSNKWPQTKGFSGVGSGYDAKQSEGPNPELVTSCLGEVDQERKIPLEHVAYGLVCPARDRVGDVPMPSGR